MSKQQSSKARWWAVGIAAVLAVGGALVASPASAHTPSVNASCDGLTVSLSNYAGERPAVPEQTETEWKYVEHGGHGVKWVDNDTFKYVDQWGHGSDHKPWFGTYYERTQDTKAVVVQQGQPAEANHVTVTVDGATKADTDFGSSWSQSYPSADQYSAHTYTVKVTAWDSSRWDVDFSKTVQACKTNPAEPQTPPSFTEWTDQGTPQCGDTTIVQERTRTDYTYTLENHKWVQHSTESTETQTRPLTDDELAALQDQCSIPWTPLTPATVKDATASMTLTPPTCADAGTPAYEIEHAVWQGPATLSDGVWTRTAKADDGHLFADGTDTAVVTVQGADALPQQSDDASAPCYVAPTVPTEPTEPTKPTEPTTPTTPTTPSTPSQPSTPSTPSTPSHSSTPTTTTHTSHAHTAATPKVEKVTPNASKSLDSAKVKTAEPKALQTAPKASQKLAHTGTPTVWYVLLGLLVLAAGLSMLAVSRKLVRR